MFSPVQQEALQAAVVDAFDLDELMELSRYRLGQRLEVLVSVNQGLDHLVFELIQLVERRGWSEEFVRGVYETASGNPAIQQFCETSARFVFLPRASTNSLAQEVGSGLSIIASRLDPGGPVRALLVGQATLSLTDIGQQFTRMRCYKALHDCLHNLYFKYARLIRAELRSLPDDPVAGDNLLTYFREMSDELANVRPLADGLESRTAEQMWLNVANESVRRMQSAIDPANTADSTTKANDATGGLRLLEGVLRVQPTRINELLTGLLERLQLSRLRDSLTTIQGTLGAEAAALQGAVDALGNLTPRLNRILVDHQEWQLVDNSLLQIDTELKLGSALDQCDFLWSEVKKILQPMLDRDSTAAWSQELRDLATKFGESFATAELVRVRTAFERFHPRAMWYFFQADKDLKELSGELDKVGDKLRDILEQVNNGHQ
ncbi:MAG: hypothetical protein JSS49_29340 [Planctomycetes bacterium]|nr:hypothetical protein [Planctomycetota bacterium]